MLARLIAVLLLLTALAPLASAAPDPTSSGVTRWVRAELDLAQPSLTTMEITGSLLIHKHPINGRTYTAQEMSRSYTDGQNFGAGVGDTFITGMESAVRGGFESMLAQSFPDSSRTITRVQVEKSTLTNSRVDAYDPPVRVSISATVVRTREAAGIGDLTDAAIQSAFSSGAIVQSAMPLAADPGYDLTFVVKAPASPAGLAFVPGTSGVVAADGSSVTLRVNNAAGALPLTQAATIRLADKSVTPPTAEDIRTTVEMRFGELREGATTLPVQMGIVTEIRAVNLGERFEGALPSSVDLAFLSAEGLRALHQSGAMTDAELDSADAAFLQTLKDELSVAFGDGLTLSGGIARGDLARAVTTPYGVEPPVKFLANATGALALPGEASKDADLALAIGAEIRFDVSLSGSNASMKYQLHAPPTTEFLEPRGGTVSADGKVATFNIAAGGADLPAGLTLRGAGSPRPTAEDADIGVVVDLRDLDISISKAAGGDMGNLIVDVTVVGNLGVIKVPDELKATLGDSLKLDFLTSDAIRLLKQRGLVTDEKLAEMESVLLETVRSNLVGALGADVVVTGGFQAASLDPKLISTPANGDKPIVFEAKTSFTKSLSGAPQTQAAIALYTVPQTFTLPRVQGLDTTYTVVLPRGLAVTGLDAPGAESSTQKWEDGRDSFTVKPGDEAAQTTVSMSVTPTFVMLKFWPVVLGAVVVLFLLIGTPIAIIVLRRRKN